MSREIIRTTDAPKSPPTYSQAVKAAGLVFVSGTGPYDASGAVTGSTIQEQTQQCLKNISAILGAAGTSLSKVVSPTVILLEASDSTGMNEEWVKWFRRPASLSGSQNRCPVFLADINCRNRRGLTTRSTRTPTGGASRFGGRRLPWFVRRR
jgi:2-iminobutanoate/2-iminopropanoate deaminase